MFTTIIIHMNNDKVTMLNTTRVNKVKQAFLYKIIRNYTYYIPPGL